MKIAIIGANGMVGKKLAYHLLTKKMLGDHRLSSIQLLDIMIPEINTDSQDIENIQMLKTSFNLSDPLHIHQLVDSEPDVIFHLAAIVSSDAEQNFEKGYAVNLDANRRLFEAIRHQQLETGYCPRLVFASSCAIFGKPFPNVIPDDFNVKPLTSYGTQKAMTELLLADYSRRGFFQGIGIRLPTISVRPGKPNKAASGFFSSIIREPLHGLDAILPVDISLRHWHASPRSAVDFFLNAALLDYAKLEGHYNLSMPGVSVTVEEQLQALQDIAGTGILKHIKHQFNEDINLIVSNWAAAFEAKQATLLGFKSEKNFKDIIRVYLEDEMDGKLL